MIELLLVAGFGALAYRHAQVHEDEFGLVPRKVGDRLGKLWDIAHQGMRENRFLRAEKALLTILKIDEKNAVSASCTPSRRNTRTQSIVLKSRQASRQPHRACTTLA
jgi:hypothetical protein